MAVFVGGKHSVSFSPSQFEVLSFTAGAVTTATETLYRFSQGAGFSEFTGNFTYDANGSLTGGTITGWKRVIDGAVEFTASGLSLPIAEFLADLENNDSAAFYQAIFGGADKITGTSADEELLAGGPGNDTLIGGAGFDGYVLEDAGDLVIENKGQGFDFVLAGFDYKLTANVEDLELTAAAQGTGNELANRIFGSSGADTLIGGAGDDRLSGEGGDDQMTGGAGNDIYIVEDAGDAITENSGEGTDTIRTVLGDFTLDTVALANVENLTLLDGAVNGAGNGLANVLTGNNAGNKLTGGAGDDTLIGGKGDDSYAVDSSGDKIVELNGVDSGFDAVAASASYVLSANIEELTLEDGAISGTGNVLDNNITGSGDGNKLFGLAGKDMILGMGGADSIDGGDGNDLLLGGNENDTLTGGLGNDNINGDGGADSLSGGAGDDTLSGGLGANTLAGGAGNDIYEIGSMLDVVIESAGQGTDTVRTELAEFSLNTPALANVENLQSSLNLGFKGTGNSLNNVIKGNGATDTLDGGVGNDTLDGTAGADQLIGGKGNDSFVVDDAGDTIVEVLNEGTDTVLSSLAHTKLGMAAFANVENLTLLDGAGQGSGNSLNNLITGNDGNNTLEGFGGSDTLIGGQGNDFYFVFEADDKVIEASGGGTNDSIQVLFNYVLPANIETLILDNSATKGTGNSLDNAIIGRSNSAEFLSGLAGNDGLSGDAQNDTLDGGVGNDSMNGGADDDSLLGGAGNDTLYGGAGNDTMAGGAGDDTYTLDDKDGTILEGVGQGVDTIQTTLLDFSLDAAALANVENLTLFTDASVGTGNGLGNLIIGSSGNDTLAGLAGNDTLNGDLGNDSLTGGAGNDTYVIDSKTDAIDEQANAGIDAIQTKLTTFSLDTPELAEVENLTLLPGGVSATGNALGNVLTGNSGFNILTGLDGNDTMIGGDGDDFYNVDSAGDKITELAGKTSGTDAVTASASYVLSANIERLDLLAGAGVIDGTGNAGGNQISGNESANKIAGLAGDDSLSGLAGDDTLDGGAGNDSMTGGAGANRMSGGAGNDRYHVQDAGDLVIEAAGQGIDTIETVLTNISLDSKALANVENLVFTFGAAIGTGNKLNNRIEGFTNGDTLDGGLGNDTLVGGGGADSLIGGKGNDVYVVMTAGAAATELAGGGIDLVQSGAADLDMAAFVNVENLIMLAGAVNAAGNEIANKISGNGGNNSLSGAAGNDTLLGGDGADSLDGGAGIDVLTGGNGNDTYIVDNAKDKVTELAGNDAGSDVVKASVDYVLAINIEQLILLDGAVNAAGNKQGNTITGNDANNKISGLDGNDALNGGNGDDTLLGGAGEDFFAGQNGDDRLEGGAGNDGYAIDDAGDLVVEAAGQGIDTAHVFAAMDYTLTANVENLQISFAGKGTGNELSNRVDGSIGGNNELSGLAGNDTLIAGTGADTMIGGAGRDRFAIASLDGNLDQVADFDAGTLGDTLDLSDLLTGYFTGSSDPSDFVQFVTAGSDTMVQVDIDGAANGVNFVDACLLEGVTLVNVNQAVLEGNLLLA